MGRCDFKIGNAPLFGVLDDGIDAIAPEVARTKDDPDAAAEVGYRTKLVVIDVAPMLESALTPS